MSTFDIDQWEAEHQELIEDERKRRDTWRTQLQKHDFCRRICKVYDRNVPEHEKAEMCACCEVIFAMSDAYIQGYKDSSKFSLELDKKYQ